MAPEVRLPPEVLACAAALRPTAANVSATLATLGQAAGRDVDLDDLRDHLSRISRASEGIEASVNELGAALNAAAPDAIHRAVGALEVHVDALRDGYAMVQPGAAHRGDADAGPDLLAAVYRSVLGQIQAWLEALLEAVDDPLAAMRRQGVAVDGQGQQEEAHAQLSFQLVLTPPAELAQLMAWAERQAERSGRPAPRTGFWSRVAAVVLGIGIADWLFLEDD